MDARIDTIMHIEIIKKPKYLKTFTPDLSKVKNSKRYVSRTSGIQWLKDSLNIESSHHFNEFKGKMPIDSVYSMQKSPKTDSFESQNKVNNKANDLFLRQSSLNIKRPHSPAPIQPKWKDSKKLPKIVNQIVNFSSNTTNHDKIKDILIAYKKYNEKKLFSSVERKFH